MDVFILSGGRIIDPANNVDMVGDLLVEQGRIMQIAKKIKPRGKIFNAKNKIVCPGLIDMHVHFRSPGQEYKEDLKSGSMAAAAGGFTTAVCMANTSPVIDDWIKMQGLVKEINENSLITILPVTSLTMGQKGEKLVNLPIMKISGARAASDDGKAIPKGEILTEAIKICNSLNLPILLHCEDYRFRPYNKESEYRYIRMVLMVVMALRMAKQYNLKVHIQHVSCGESVELIRRAKAKGVKVTCETAPHYMALTKDAVKFCGTNAKMNPPLRSAKDRLAIRKGLGDGTIDAIATDHAPHALAEKRAEFDQAPFGVIGLETAVPVCLSSLLNMSISEIIRKMTSNPAGILGIERGSLGIGALADITVIDPGKVKMADPQNFYSKSRNCPWNYLKFKGWPAMTIKAGEIIMKDGKIVQRNRFASD